MRPLVIIELVFFVSLLAWAIGALAIGQPASIAFAKTEGGLKLGGMGPAPAIVINSKDWPGFTRTENNLINDFELVTGTKGKFAISTSGLFNNPVIIVGTIGKSPLIDSIVSAGKIDVLTIKGKWESFTLAFVLNPVDGISSTLVLAGSDKRGIIFTLYDISEQIGVSP